MQLASYRRSVTKQKSGSRPARPELRQQTGGVSIIYLLLKSRGYYYLLTYLDLLLLPKPRVQIYAETD